MSASLPELRGRVAMWCLIAAEAAIFTIFVVAYVFYLGKSVSGPQPRDVLQMPVVLTICLLSSSVTITLAERAFSRDRVGRFKMFWLMTIVMAAIFLASTAVEWRRLMYEKGLTISTNLFGTTFYSLIGLHAFHVVVGLTGLSEVTARWWLNNDRLLPKEEAVRLIESLAWRGISNFPLLEHEPAENTEGADRTD